MKIVCKNLIQLEKKTLENFLYTIRNSNLNFACLEICVPDSYAVNGDDIDSIDSGKCTGCLACIDDGEIDYITINDVPTHKKSRNRNLSQVASNFFKGSYISPIFSNKLAIHTRKNEIKILNPLSALLCWRLSLNSRTTYFCSSPNWELSIETDGKIDEREGHLDVVLASSDSPHLITLEGKKTVEDLLDSKYRGQWLRYSGVIESIAERYGYHALFCYLIGGDELPLYPPNTGAPHHMLQSEFYNLIKSNNHRFISIEALRALRAYRISIDQDWSWELYFPNLFSNPLFVGIITGGIVFYEQNKFVLKKAPWI